MGAFLRPLHLLLLGEAPAGLSFNAVADLLGTTAQSMLRWLCGYVDRWCSKPPPGEAVVIELDEM
jgi:hypothetical protein